jgi:hypothetical protein
MEEVMIRCNISNRHLNNHNSQVKREARREAKIKERMKLYHQILNFRFS